MLERYRQEQSFILNLELDLEKKFKIEKLLDKVCSENPLDPQKTKHRMKANIKLQNPKDICRVKPMKYSPQDIKEFVYLYKPVLSIFSILKNIKKKLNLNQNNEQVSYP